MSFFQKPLGLRVTGSSSAPGNALLLLADGWSSLFEGF
jgi:hypothetical protein